MQSSSLFRLSVQINPATLNAVSMLADEAAMIGRCKRKRQLIRNQLKLRNP